MACGAAVVKLAVRATPCFATPEQRLAAAGIDADAIYAAALALVRGNAPVADQGREEGRTR